MYWSQPPSITSTFANILDSALYNGVISIANLTYLESNCLNIKISEIVNRLHLKINRGGGGILYVKTQVDTAYIGSLALISYILNTELHLDMLAQTETNIEYNSSSNRIQTILPHVDMEQYTISNTITASITKLQAKLSALLSEINYQHIFNMLRTADVSNIISSRSRLHIKCVLIC